MHIQRRNSKQEVQTYSLYPLLSIGAVQVSPQVFRPARPEYADIVMVDSVNEYVEGRAEGAGDNHFDQAGFISYASQCHQAFERAAKEKICCDTPDCAYGRSYS